MSNGYIKLPRSLFFDPLWKSLPLDCQWLFIEIVIRACFFPQKFDDHGHIIHLECGQLCTTFREMAEWNKKITKHRIENFVKKLITYGFLRQEPQKELEQKRGQESGQKRGRRKTVFSICHKDTLSCFNKESGQESGQEWGQNGDKTGTQNKNGKNEKKEEKKINKERDPLVAALLSAFYDSLFSVIPSFNPNSAKKTDSQYQAMERLVRVHGEVKVREVFTFAHKDSFWVMHVHTPVYLANKFEKLLIKMHLGVSNDQAGSRSGEKPAYTGSSRKHVDRRTRNTDGTHVSNVVEGVF